MLGKSKCCCDVRYSVVITTIDTLVILQEYNLIDNLIICTLLIIRHYFVPYYFTFMRFIGLKFLSVK